MRVLLVEDDAMIGEAVRKGLRAEGFAVDWIDNGLSAETLATVADTDLVRRDGINRSYIFSREVDPVWNQITPLLGMENCEAIRQNLLTNDIVTEVPA